MIDPKLEGRVALITGANHGIGEATARALAAQGVKVFITYYRPPLPYTQEELDRARRVGEPGLPYYWSLWQRTGEEVAEEIQAVGGIAVAQEMDLGEPEAIPNLLDQVEVTLGPVEILIVNHTHFQADTFDPGRATDDREGPTLTCTEVIDRHFTVNARATALLIREYAGRQIARRAKWGRIITLTTSHAHPGAVSYAASKAAIVSYTLSAAAELGKYGITANVVMPGANQTGYITPELEEMIVRETPLGRLSTPEDAARAILFLVSEQGGWITGNQLCASGGFQCM